MPALFPIADSLVPPASIALDVYCSGRFEEAVTYCQKELAPLEEQIPAKSTGLPRQEGIESVPFQYFALTCTLVNALAELGKWKPAKEALGKYRVHFPRDPWGFAAGAEVTRRDPQVTDRAAVERAAELLEAEGKRLEATPSRMSKK